MATIAEQLTNLANTKTAIKDAIVAKGVEVADTDPFSAYPSKIGQISGGGAPATKFGVSIDNLLGNVDENGYLDAPTEPFVFDGTGIKHLYFCGLNNRFNSGNAARPIPVTKILLPDLEGMSGSVSGLAENASRLTEVDIRKLSNIKEYSEFASAFRNCSSLSVLHMEGVVEISGGTACSNAFYDCISLKNTGLPNLTTISGSTCCQYMYYGCVFEELGLDNLTTISGPTGCQYMFGKLAIDDAEFPKLSAITGTNACRYWFSDSTVKRVYFPALITVVASAFASTTSNGAFRNCTNLTEIHFRADAQATIEAMTGYSNKWGATNATIYFDL